jgi:hypothetical protein
VTPANGVASASHIKTPPTVTAAVIHKTRSILVIWDSIICHSDGSFYELLFYTLRNRRATCAGRKQHERRNKEANIKNPTIALTAVAVLLGGLLLLKSDATALPGLGGGARSDEEILFNSKGRVFFGWTLLSRWIPLGLRPAT